jgi:hypothetical protein
MSAPKILLVISDIHCGSEVGLMPPDSKTKSKNTLGFGKNIHQKWLWDKWLQMQEEFHAYRKKDPFVLLLNGDLTEGIHHHSVESLSQSIEDHANMAIEALTPLADKAEQIFVTLGTECHTGMIEHMIADKLEARSGAARGTWLFKVGGCLVNATHHIGTATRAYTEAGQLSGVMANARLQSARAGHQPAQIYLRGHRHTGGWFSDGCSMIGVTGAWQFLTRFGKKVVPDSVPRPSVLILDWRNTKSGHLPAIKELVYAPEQEEIDVIS